METWLPSDNSERSLVYAGVKNSPRSKFFKKSMEHESDGDTECDKCT